MSWVDVAFWGSVVVLLWTAHWLDERRARIARARAERELRREAAHALVYAPAPARDEWLQTFGEIRGLPEVESA